MWHARRRKQQDVYKQRVRILGCGPAAACHTFLGKRALPPAMTGGLSCRGQERFFPLPTRIPEYPRQFPRPEECFPRHLALPTLGLSFEHCSVCRLEGRWRSSIALNTAGHLLALPNARSRARVCACVGLDFPFLPLYPPLAFSHLLSRTAAYRLQDDSQDRDCNPHDYKTHVERPVSLLKRCATASPAGPRRVRFSAGADDFAIVFEWRDGKMRIHRAGTETS